MWPASDGIMRIKPAEPQSTFVGGLKSTKKTRLVFGFLVLPGFEPGLADSKSAVITNYTTEPGGIALTCDES